MRRWNPVAFLASASCLATPALAQTAPRDVLPATVVPTHYDLAIRPDLATHTFTGTNAITLDVKAATQDIVLNADELSLDQATLETGASGQTAIDKTLNRATIHFAAPVMVGRHVLTIAYHGRIGRDTLGIFGMDYDTPQGRRTMLGTNLEPASARQVFPGWDEPAIKATYTVTVDAPADLVAVSNMPVARKVAISPTTNRVTFAQSPRMSSYLFFLGLGDMERIHREVDGVDVGVMVKRGDTAKGAYALDQAARLLHWYNGYFGTPYPLPKLDLIAAPGSIQGDSMENWGAIFYSQNSLLFDPAASTEADRQRVFMIVAHEMAHQWFGDLVTMAWWDDLWLNEGFARWMQTYAADALHPEWKTGLKAQAIFESGRASDALPSAHPVLQSVATANQASQAFDDITYDKGAAVITMLASDIGEDAFRTGVRRYIRAHAYGNTVDADLWGVMQQVANKPVMAIGHDFTTRPGVPLIRVATTAQGVHLAEDVFRSGGPSAQASAAQWRIPLTVGPVGGAGTPLLLTGDADVAVSGPALVNAGQTAYARVLYPQPMFHALADKVPAMAAVDQIGLLQDAQALGNAGYAPGSNVLALVSRLPVNADAVVWLRAADALMDIDDAYDDTGAHKSFQTYAIGLIRPALAAIGAQARPQDAPNDAILRERLIEALGQLGDAATLAHARALYASGKGSPAEQRSALSVAAAKADRAFFDALLARARSTPDPLQKLHLYRALVSADDPAFARAIVDVLLSGEIPAGTSQGLIERFAAAQPDLAWTLAVPRLNDEAARLDPTMQWETAMHIAALSSDPARIPQYRAYLDAHVPVDARKAMLGAIASIDLNHRIATTVLPDIDRWIAARRLRPQARAGG